uniref:methylated diphthine methylhydrolase n=1 Tax=Pyramimonas obovata TaxID=1411642 RepID=A0A7S0N1X6_9CHLO|mmetsp:Transcript_16308/g.35455  ORF Transcript_16308/g.35455 Transcript_16308/m.35455 type:complete len:388 (+) Transcript_16308:559-1722(+)|eukprot:CAMPEP_0118934494 /NCGR_PEP_ID=MMETSP1169-20130426/13854_1 /TAXON_ID=36882 /ORGANISM="Pyramimonas obovata, Strain CCMP722" /LENGTH=387 /DNA_ID=CAMNT_0006877405 /DNA_START=534 /DNA_END=1697 /DNA_ORIENTATION=-
MADTTTTHASVTLDLDVDIVEFCNQACLPEVLAVGTYTLEESTKERIGKLYLFELTNVLDDSASTGLKELTQHDTEAIFDLAWAPFETSSANGGTAALLAQAGAGGNVEVYSVSRDQVPSDVGCADHSDDPTARAVNLDRIQKLECSLEGGLCTSVDWSHPDMSPTTLLATSTSACELVVLDAAAPGRMSTLVHMAGAHDLEIWNVAFDRWKPMLLFSGADDCAFKGWDLRIAGGDEEAEPALEGVFTNRRIHSAGVCCIVPSPWEENKVFTGSYDQTIRLWDLRALNRPVVQTELETEGGVWRIKCHPTKPGTVAAACMYGGFFVMEGFCGGAEPAVIQEYVGSHDKAKIAYGVDWYKGEAASQSVAASCSFYDRVLNIWSSPERV